MDTSSRRLAVVVSVKIPVSLFKLSSIALARDAHIIVCSSGLSPGITVLPKVELVGNKRIAQIQNGSRDLVALRLSEVLLYWI